MTAVPELRGDRIVLNAHNDSEAAAHAAGEDEETARRFGWWPARRGGWPPSGLGRRRPRRTS